MHYYRMQADLAVPADGLALLGGCDHLIHSLSLRQGGEALDVQAKGRERYGGRLRLALVNEIDLALVQENILEDEAGQGGACRGLGLGGRGLRGRGQLGEIE